MELLPPIPRHEARPHALASLQGSARLLPLVGLVRLMIPELDRLEAYRKDMAKIGRPAGVANKPIPPKEGPLWQAFLAWYPTASVGAGHRLADLWRAFSAGAGSNAAKPNEG